MKDCESRNMPGTRDPIAGYLLATIGGRSTHLSHELLHFCAVAQQIQLRLAQVLLLLALVQIIVVAGPPEVAQQELHGVELQIEHGVQEGLAMLPIQAPEGVHVLQGQFAVEAVVQLDGRKRGQGTGSIADVLETNGRNKFNQ